MLTSLPSAVLLIAFAAGAAAIWVAGVKLSNTTDVLSQRWHLGSALGGVILLAVATNLPELAITASAAVSHHLDVAVGNILGGIALQTVVLVALDAAGARHRKPLTYLTASITPVLEGALVVALLVVVVMGTQLPATLKFWRLTPGPVLIAVLWIAGLLVVRRAGRGLPWHAREHVPQSAPAGGGTDVAVRTTRAVLVFAAAAGATLVGGVLVELSGEEVFGRWGMSGVLFGATVLAAATALPELSTGIAAVRLGNYRLAISDIFGGNAFLPVLFLLATLLSGSPVLPTAHHSDIYLTALAGLLTLVYMVGLILRPQRQWLGLGLDSIVVLVLYVVGIAGLTFVIR